MFRESQEIKDDVWDCTLIKNMKNHSDTIVNPIYDWLNTDIWEYIRQENIRVNPLYAEGYERIGCIGCPLAKHSERMKDFERYPVYKQNYIRAFEKMIENRNKSKDNNTSWKTGEEVFDWWIEKYKYDIKGQMTIEDFI